MSQYNTDPPLSPSHLSQLLGRPPSSPQISQWLESLTGSSTSPPSPQIKSYPDVQYHLYPSFGIDLVFVQTDDGTGWGLDRIDIYNPSSGSITPAPTNKRRAGPVYLPPCLPVIIRPVKPGVDSAGISSTTTTTNESLEERSDSPRSREDDVLEVQANTTGREFVAVLGEPSRKGGGTASVGLSLGVGPWIEWSDLRIRSSRITTSTTAGITNANQGEGEWEEVGIGLMVELRESMGGVTEDDLRKGLGGVWDRAAGWDWGCIKFFRVGSTI